MTSNVTSILFSIYLCGYRPKRAWFMLATTARWPIGSKKFMNLVLKESNQTLCTVRFQWDNKRVDTDSEQVQRSDRNDVDMVDQAASARTQIHEVKFASLSL